MTAAASLFSDQPRQRMAPALAFSLSAHVLVLLLAIGLYRSGAMSLAQDRARRAFVDDVVWLNQPGPGGGGGGGGNQTPEPPRLVQVKGRAMVSMPAAPPPPVQTAASEPPRDVPVEQHLEVPFQFAGANLDVQPGVVTGGSATGSQGPGSGGGAGGGRGTGIGNGTGSGMGDGSGGGFGGGVYRPGAGIESPQLIREVKPLYTDDGMRLRIRGTAWLECIVLADGTVGSVRILRSLDARYGLDEEAIKAAKQWRFRPARRAGVPVPILITIAMDFNLQ